jgi:prepilin-type N-terminal cleavage/methylation domain-containing protein
MTQQKKGFSLIEVVIALAIFVIGALAIIRIFPTGLGLVEKSGNQQRAANFNRSVVAALKNSDSIPYAIVNTNTADTWEPFNGSVIGSAKYNNTLPASLRSTDLTNSALEKYKSISREKTKVRNGTDGSFILTQFSVDPTRNVSIFQEDTLENVTISANGTLDLTSATKKNGSLFTAPTDVETNRTFYVTYRHSVGTMPNQHIFGVVEEPVKAIASGVIKVSASSVIPGIATVVVREPLAGSITLTPEKARCGLINLSGLPTGTEEVSIDYTTDWYWLLEELTPTNADDVFKRRVIDPATGNAVVDPTENRIFKQVELSIPFVQPRTQGRFATLLMENGGRGRHFSWLNNGNDSMPPANSAVRFPSTVGSDTIRDEANFRNTLREGKICFNLTDPLIATPTPIKSPLVRVAYRTQDGWARQVSVSAKSYKPYTSNNIERWRDYAPISTSNYNTLFFQPSEAGKAVRVTYTYGNGTADADKTITELLVIKNEVEELPTGNTPLGPGVNIVVRLEIDPPGANNVTAILSVKGASITARTAWMTNNKYSHNLLTSMRSDS